MEQEFFELLKGTAGPAGTIIVIGFFLWKKIEKIQTMLTALTMRIIKIETILKITVERLEKTDG